MSARRSPTHGTMYHAKLVANSGSQVLRQLYVTGAGSYAWSATLLLAKHYESVGLSTHLSRWTSPNLPSMGNDRTVDITVLPGDDMPW